MKREAWSVEREEGRNTQGCSTRRNFALSLPAKKSRRETLFARKWAETLLVYAHVYEICFLAPCTNATGLADWWHPEQGSCSPVRVPQAAPSRISAGAG